MFLFIYGSEFVSAGEPLQVEAEFIKSSQMFLSVFINTLCQFLFPVEGTEGLHGGLWWFPVFVFVCFLSFFK